VKNSINTASGELSLLMCTASLFFKPFAVQTNGWILCSFLEAVPRLVILRHLLQLGVRVLVLNLLLLLLLLQIQ
jgi:hypothetical protein